MTPSQVNQRISGLEDAIDFYEGGKLKRNVASLNRQFGFEVGFAFVVPIIATVLSALFVNLAAMFAPIVIGVANIADKFALSKTVILSYFKDKDALWGRAEGLRGRLQLAKIQPNQQKQNEMLDDIEKKLFDYYQ
jgi:hypothetical protein